MPNGVPEVSTLLRTEPILGGILADSGYLFATFFRTAKWLGKPQKLFIGGASMRKVEKHEYELFCLGRMVAGDCLASYDDKTGIEWRMDRSDRPVAYAQWKNGTATYYVSDGSFS